MKFKNVKMLTAKRITAFALVFILILSVLPFISLAAEEDLKIINSGADEVTPIPEAGDLADGEIWTDKSVEYEQDGIYTVTLRAFGKRWAMDLAEYNEHRRPVNAVFVLDTSSSMSYNSLKAQINAVVEAGTIILNANPGKNHVAVVYFDRSARLATGTEYGYFTGNPDAATSVSGSSVWAAVRQVHKSWIWADTAENMSELIEYDGNNQLAPKTTGATNIVSGLNLAYALLNGGGELPAAPNKNEANPIIILMSDGAPNYYSTNGSYTNSTAGTSSPGAAGDANSAAETIKRAAEIRNSYIGTNPNNIINIYTVGYNVENNYLAWITLNPKNDHSKLSGSQAKINVNSSLSGSDVIFTSGDKTVNITGGGTNGTEYYQYNKNYYVPLYPQDLITAFREIVDDVTFDPASPLANETNLVITDVISGGFELIPGSFLPNDLNANYNSATKTVTWTIPASELYLVDPEIWGNAGENPDVIYGSVNTLTFKIKTTGEIDPDKSENGIYFTNNGAYSDFTPSSKNDHYSNKGKNRTELLNKGWLQYESPESPDDTTEPVIEEDTTDDTTDTTEPTGYNATEAATIAATSASPYYPPYNTPYNPQTSPAFIPTTAGNNNPAADEPTANIDVTALEETPETAIPPETVAPLEEIPEDRIPLAGGGFAVELEEDLYEIFDDEGIPLGDLQFGEDENIKYIEDITDMTIEDIEILDGFIPLENITAEENKQTAKDNPKTSDFTLYSLLLYLVMTAVSGIMVGKIQKAKKFKKQ